MPEYSARLNLDEWRAGCCSGHDRAKRIHLQVPTLRSSTCSVPSAVNCEAEKDFVTSSRYLIRSLDTITDQVGNVPGVACDRFGGSSNDVMRGPRGFPI
jgi:hypothetical protein